MYLDIFNCLSKSRYEIIAPPVFVMNINKLYVFLYNLSPIPIEVNSAIIHIISITFVVFENRFL